jgi:type II secretory pathway pseudopilin PulG
MKRITPARIFSKKSRALTRVALGGFMLIEVLLAISIFGLAALGLMRALTYTATAANDSKLDLRMMSLLQSTMTQYSRANQIEETERPIVTEPDELGVWTEVTIQEMNEKNGNELKTSEKNQNGAQPLQNMFLITVTAHYELENGDKGEISADTIRFAPLYRPTNAQQ